MNVRLPAIRRTRSAALAVVALALAGTAVPVASASRTQESIFQDDNHLVYGTPSTVERTMRTLKHIGVDRIRVSVYWRLVAPSPTSRIKPSFDATDPGAYPQDNWARYDTIVKLALKHRLAVDFNVTSPVPDWAAGDPGRDDIRDTYDPSPSEFEKFVMALGKRYSGSYVPSSSAPAASPPPERCNILDPNCQDGAPPPQASTAAAHPIPRVSYWTVWNEPNQGGWLTPQWKPDPKRSGHYVDVAPKIYRGLVDAAWSALGKTDHQRDTILVGEIAPKGAEDRGETRPIKALRFVRSLYCVGANFRPLAGDQASARGCPTTPEGVAGFAAAHPGLFKMTGFAHHPYSLVNPPARQSAGEPDFVTLADLPRLTRTLNSIMRTYSQPLAPGGVPIFFTEYGYQTNPPDPYSGYSLAKQAAFLDQAEYIAYGYPSVVSSAQFLLYDDKPFTQFPKGSLQYWGTFQTGLIRDNGKAKPSFGAYRLPIWISSRSKRRGHSFPIWGMLRMARNASKQTARIQFRKRGAKTWRTVKVVKTRNPRGFFTTRAGGGHSGSFRIAYRKGKTMYYSRAVSVRVR